MDNLQIILDNAIAVNHTFMYYLHERKQFDIEQFNVLMKAIISISNDFEKKENKDIAYKIHFIHAQIIYHILYHFAPNDCYNIENLPPDYQNYLDELGFIVHNLLYHEL